MQRNLEIQLELTAHRCTQAVKELTEAWAPEVILHVAGIEMVRDVEDGHADPRPVLIKQGEAKAFGHLRVKRDERGETPRPVARPDEVQLFINY